jgi:hypothetical protein
MSEHELLESFRSSFDQAWTQLQWWASVSFGLIALTHFAARKLNLAIVVCVSLLYVLFTIYVSLNVQALTLIGVGYLKELEVLRDSGEIGPAALSILDFASRYGLLNSWIYRLCVVATCIGTISYLVYTYRKGLRSRKDEARADAA